MLQTTIIRVVPDIVTDTGIACDSTKLALANISTRAAIIGIARRVDTGPPAAIRPGIAVTGATETSHAGLGATLIVEDTGRAVLPTATDAVRADLGREADVSAVSAILGVTAGVDTAEVAADLSGAIETGAAAAIARAALTVILARLLILDAGGLLIRTPAGVEIQELAIGAGWDALDAALLCTVRAGAESLVGIGTGGAAGTAVLATSDLRGRAAQGGLAGTRCRSASRSARRS